MAFPLRATNPTLLFDHIYYKLLSHIFSFLETSLQDIANLAIEHAFYPQAN